MRSLRYTLTEKNSEPSCLLYMESCNYVVTGHDDGSVKFWNPDSMKCRVERGHTNTVTALVAATVNRRPAVVSASYDGTISAYVVPATRSSLSWLNMTLSPPDSSLPEPLLPNLPACPPEILCLTCWEGTLVSGGNAPCLISWDVDAQQSTSHPSPPTTCMAHDGALLFGGGEDGVVTMYNQDFSTSGTIKAHQGYIRCMLFNLYLFTGAADGVKVWDYPTQTMLRAVKHHDEPPRCLGVRGNVLHVGTEEGGVVKFDIDVGEDVGVDANVLEGEEGKE